MKLLFDFISLQGSINGGAEYTRRVLDELLQKKQSKLFSIVGLYDSTQAFIMNAKNKYEKDIEDWIDINCYNNICDITTSQHFDVFFIGIFQNYMKYNLNGIQCKVVVVIHDIASVEIQNSRLYLLKPESKKQILKNNIKAILRKFSNRYKEYDKDFVSHKDFLLNMTTHIVTVSYFSQKSIKYNIPFLKNKDIHVLYAPLRKIVQPAIETKVKELLDTNKKYFLILSSKRWLKNADMALEVINRFSIEHPDYYVVTTGSNYSAFKNQIALSYINENQLAYVLKNATALIYPTLMEGFGYPPIESMCYGVPVLSSGMASLPEILGEDSIYFSPFYKCDLYDKLNQFVKMDYPKLKKKSLERYRIIKEKQEQDLQELLKLIIQ